MISSPPFPTSVLLLVLAAFWSPLVAAESRPNVVMILTDDQRHDAAGFTGNTAIHTPNLDRLAKAGLIFNNCFVNTAICCVNRAISGGPVYVADELGKTDFSLLRKLVFSDRTVPLCLGPARPTEDSLFVDPAGEPGLTKIFNRNPAGGGVIGVFNCGYNPATNRLVSGAVSVSDVPGLAGQEFAIYVNQAGTLRRVTATDRLPVALRELGFELFTIAPIQDGFAAIGLADKFNSGGCITAIRRDERSRMEVDLRDGGEFIAWAAQSPRAVLSDGKKLAFSFDQETRALRVNVPVGRPITIIIEL